MSAHAVQIPPGPLFEPLGARERAVVARFGTPVSTARGGILCGRGAVAREAVVLVEGRAVAGDGRTAVLLGAGDVLGAHEVLERRPHPRTVVARTEMSLVVYDARELLELLDAAPTVAARLRARAVTEPARQARRAAAKATMSA